MIGFLAFRSLGRQRSRTLLTVLGLLVSTALLYDMALLSTGLRTSLEHVLDQMGYELRVLPKGSLPFTSEAALPHGSRLARDLASVPGVARTMPLWATTLYLSPSSAGPARPAAPVAVFALGLDPGTQTLYAVDEGPGIRAADETVLLPLIVNRSVADTLRLSVGDTVRVAIAPDAAGGTPAAPALVVIAGIATFRLDMHRQRTVSLRLPDLQKIAGRDADDPAAFVLGGLAPGADAASVVERWRGLHPETDIYSVDDLLGQVRGQLSYFRQFSLILGTVSLLVTFLLILTLLTLGVNERQGEIAILRAIGLPARRVVGLVMIEGLLLTALALGPGLALGALASTALDAILKTSPGIPADLSFFVFTPATLVRTVLLVLVSGTLAGTYPALLAARTNIVATLHREVT
ncbi:MAG: ABC transporter permease [Candidatus Eiseniibacteriota bacterium]